MENFKKIIMPCKCEVFGKNKPQSAFCEITYNDKRLSISGVVGPRSNGGYNMAGQCIDKIKKGIPAEHWNSEMLQKFCDIWKRWHLNDMRPYCEHQAALGWDKIANESVDIYNYTLKLDVVVEKNRIKGLVQKAIIETGHADVDEKDRKILTLPYSVKSHYSYEEFCEHDKQAKYYKPDKIRPKETEKLSFVKQEDHPAGLLCKPCPVCGYRYGTKWNLEIIPEDILQWLHDLPESSVIPKCFY